MRKFFDLLFSMKSMCAYAMACLILDLVIQIQKTEEVSGLVLLGIGACCWVWLVFDLIFNKVIIDKKDIHVIELN